jgi:hypothetical protein
MIMAVAALVREKPKPSDADINNAIKPNSQTPTPASLPPRNRSSMCGRPTPGGDPLDSLIPPRRLWSWTTPERAAESSSPREVGFHA